MNVSDGVSTLYRFGPFVLDRQRRVVSRDGQPVALRPTVFDTLLYLVENPGRIVTKEELFEAVWPGRVVGESNISQTILALRKALGENHCVVTAPGQGYRFATAVTVDAGGAAPPSSAPPSPRRDRRRAFQLGVGFGAALLAVGGGFVAIQPWRAAPAAGPAGVIVVSDFENDTANPIFDKTLTAAAAIDLRQSPRLLVLSQQKVQDTLNAMTRSPTERLTPAVAREVCIRNNGQETLDGAVAQVGGRYLLTLTATACGDGKVIAADKAEVDSPGALLPALDGLVDRLRRDLGETTVSVQAFNVPLVSRRTASLEALKAYSEATALFDHGRHLEAIPLYQRAIELDPKFAMAYADLARAYEGLHETKSASDLITRAYALRDTAGERDKFDITLRYGRIVTQDDLAVIRSLRSWASLYPDDPEPRLDLASEEEWLGQVGPALADGLRALAMAPDKERAYEIVMRAYLLANKVDQARAIGALAIARHVDGDRIHRRLFEIAVASDDQAAAARELQWSRDKPAERILLIDAGQAAISLGQVRRAQTLFDRALVVGKAAGLGNYFAGAYARLLADIGLKDAARRELAEAPPGFDSTDYRVTLAEVGDARRAEALLASAVARAPSDTLLNAMSAAETRAALAMGRGQAAQAVEALGPAAPYELTDFSVPYQRGLAYLAQSDGAHAAAEFLKILNNRGVEPLSVHYPMARLGLARALRLQGDLPGSRRAYARFLQAWKDADPDVPELAAAKAEYARL